MAYQASTYPLTNSLTNTATDSLYKRANHGSFYGAALYTGYNGPNTIIDCRNNLLHEVLENPASTLEDKINQGFRNFQNKLKESSSNAKCGDKSGCSASVVVTNGIHLAIGTAGDNAILIYEFASVSYRGERLMKPHSMENITESIQLQERYNESCNEEETIAICAIMDGRQGLYENTARRIDNPYYIKRTQMTRGLGNIWSNGVISNVPETIQFSNKSLQGKVIVMVSTNLAAALTEEQIANIVDRHNLADVPQILIDSAEKKLNEPMSSLVIDCSQFCSSANGMMQLETDKACSEIQLPPAPLFEEVTLNRKCNSRYLIGRKILRRHILRLKHQTVVRRSNISVADAEVSVTTETVSKDVQTCFIEDPKPVYVHKRIQTEDARDKIHDENCRAVRLSVVAPLEDVDPLRVLELITPENWKKSNDGSSQQYFQYIIIPESWGGFEECEIFVNFKQTKADNEIFHPSTESSEFYSSEDMDLNYRKWDNAWISDDIDKHDASTERCIAIPPRIPSYTNWSSPEYGCPRTPGPTALDIAVKSIARSFRSPSNYGSPFKQLSPATHSEQEFATEVLVNMLNGDSSSPQHTPLRSDVIEYLPNQRNHGPPRKRFRKLRKSRHFKSWLTDWWTTDPKPCVFKQEEKGRGLKRKTSQAPVRDQRVFKVRLPNLEKKVPSCVDMKCIIKEDILKGIDTSFLTPDFLNDALKLKATDRYERELACQSTHLEFINSFVVHGSSLYFNGMMGGPDSINQDNNESPSVVLSIQESSDITEPILLSEFFNAENEDRDILTVVKSVVDAVLNELEEVEQSNQENPSVASTRSPINPTHENNAHEIIELIDNKKNQIQNTAHSSIPVSTLPDIPLNDNRQIKSLLESMIDDIASEEQSKFVPFVHLVHQNQIKTLICKLIGKLKESELKSNILPNSLKQYKHREIKLLIDAILENVEENEQKSNIIQNQDQVYNKMEITRVLNELIEMLEESEGNSKTNRHADSGRIENHAKHMLHVIIGELERVYVDTKNESLNEIKTLSDEVIIQLDVKNFGTDSGGQDTLQIEHVLKNLVDTIADDHSTNPNRATSTNCNNASIINASVRNMELTCPSKLNQDVRDSINFMLNYLEANETSNATLSANKSYEVYIKPSGKSESSSTTGRQRTCSKRASPIRHQDSIAKLKRLPAKSMTCPKDPLRPYTSPEVETVLSEVLFKVDAIQNPTRKVYASPCTSPIKRKRKFRALESPCKSLQNISLIPLNTGAIGESSLNAISDEDASLKSTVNDVVLSILEKVEGCLVSTPQNGQDIISTNGSKVYPPKQKSTQRNVQNKYVSSKTLISYNVPDNTSVERGKASVLNNISNNTSLLIHVPMHKSSWKKCMEEAISAAVTDSAFVERNGMIPEISTAREVVNSSAATQTDRNGTSENAVVRFGLPANMLNSFRRK